MSTHSYVIDALKTIPQQLDNKWSTDQLLEVLDTLLSKALYHVMLCSDFVDYRLLQTATWYSTSQRRKISQLPKEQFIAFAMLFSGVKDPKVKLSLYQQHRIERSLAITIIGDWINHAEALALAESKTDDASAVRAAHERHVLRMHASSPYVFQFLNAVKYLFKKAVDFRYAISSKYSKLIIKEAVGYQRERRSSVGSRQSTNDVAQTMLLCLFTAIDKCDSGLGTLASYVQNWIGHAKTTSRFRDEAGTAFTLPSGQRRAASDTPNFTVDVSDIALANVEDGSVPIEEKIDSARVTLKIRRLARAADPTGVGRLTLGITEVLSRKDREALIAASASLALTK